MNELVFVIQSILIIGFALASLRLGREALVAWVTVQALIANLFVLKQINLFHLEVTASDSFAIGSLLGLNLLQEHFGREEANRATKICFFYMVFFTFISQLHLIYEPNLHDSTQSAFLTLFSPAPRLMIASMGVFFVVQQLDICFFDFLKKKMSTFSFAVRGGISLLLSQLLDTILFSFFGLYGIVTSVIDIIVVSFAIKFIVILCFTSYMRIVKI